MMSFCGLYKCKQCGSVFSDNELKNLPDETVCELLSNTNENDAAKCAKFTRETIIHRCDPQTVGLCEFIGWRKQE